MTSPPLIIAFSPFLLAVINCQADDPIKSVATSMTNPDKFPLCLTKHETKGTNFQCLHYMCLPWRKTTIFRNCQENMECLCLTEKEGGDGRHGQCHKHPDRRNLHGGICLKQNEKFNRAQWFKWGI